MVVSVRQNDIYKKSGSLTVDPGVAATDSYIQFDVNTVNKFRVGVDDTDDSFRISHGNDLGANNRFKMSSSGERTMPSQPAFLGVVTSDILNVTGDGTTYSIVGTERFDQSGSLALGVFTAPVSGVYRFDAGIGIGGIGVGHDRVYFSIYSDTVTKQYPFGICSPATVRDANGQRMSINAKTIAVMDAADRYWIFINVRTGVKTVDVFGGAIVETWFSGSLIC